MRKVNISDFENTGTIKAQYFGHSKYLVRGNWYNIRFMSKRNLVSVPLCDNPQLGKSNSGVEFSMNMFYIGEE